MAPRSRVLLFVCATLVLCFGSLSCTTVPVAVEDPESDPRVQAELARRTRGEPGHGFICWGAPDRVGCVCDDNAPSGDLWSCEGMERVCEALGTGQICNPSTDMCSCIAKF